MASDQQARSVEIEDIARGISEKVFGRSWDGFGGIGDGLACGLNPWTDFCLSQWKDASKRSGLMVVMNDWFSLDSTLRVKSLLNFRYHEGITSTNTKTWSNFWNNLRRNSRAGRNFSDYLAFSRYMITEHNALFTNAMSCVRRGEGDVGNRNISPKSFENCRPHLAQQIELAKPKIIVTMGNHSQSSVFSIFEERWLAEHRDLVARLAPGGVPQLNNRGRNMLSEAYESDPEFVGIKASLSSGETTVVIPMYHSSFQSNYWIHDNELLGRAVDLLLIER